MPSYQRDLPSLVYNVEIDDFFGNGNSYIFRRNDATEREVGDHCHYDVTDNHNTHVYVGCCGGTGSTNCGDGAVELVYMRAHRSIEFFSKWDSSRSSNISM